MLRERIRDYVIIWLVYIDGNLYVSANGSPNVALLDPIHGVLETSLKYPERSGQDEFVNSEEVPYFLLPEDLYESSGIQLGDIGVFIYNNQIAYAVYADVGESQKSVGVSIALANARMMTLWEKITQFLCCL